MDKPNRPKKSIDQEFVVNSKVAGLSLSKVDQAVLEPSRLAARLTGLLSSNTPGRCYAENRFGDYVFKVVERAWPNNYARLDILLINDEPAGTILAIKYSADLFHMVGMFIKEEFRGKEFRKNVSGDVVSKSPAAYFMEQYKKDLLESSQSMTLEVMNYNLPAIKLYEKEFLSAGQSLPGFSLLSREKIVRYAKLRRKKIGRWHNLTNSGLPGCGVQWKHIPDYNNTTTWSVSRVYLFNPKGRNLEYIHYGGSMLGRILFNTKLIASFVRYGTLLRGGGFALKRYFKSKVAKKK